jgi:hypothetical protein
MFLDGLKLVKVPKPNFSRIYLNSLCFMHIIFVRSFKMTQRWPKYVGVVTS